MGIVGKKMETTMIGTILWLSRGQFIGLRVTWLYCLRFEV